MAAGDAGDQLLTMLEHDWVSDTSMTHLSFMLRHATGMHCVADEAVARALHAAESGMESRFRDDPDVMALCTGSAYEGVFPLPQRTPDGDLRAATLGTDVGCVYVFRKWSIDAPPENRKEVVKEGEEEGPAPELGAGAGAEGGMGGVGMVGGLELGGLKLPSSRDQGQLALAHYVTTDSPGRVCIRLKTVSKELSKFAVRRSDQLYLSRHLLAAKVKEVIGDDDVTVAMDDLHIADGGAVAGGVPGGVLGCARAAWVDTAPRTRGLPDFREAPTYGFASGCWPAEAAEWLCRRRRHEWPEAADVTSAAGQGCHLVATSMVTEKVHAEAPQAGAELEVAVKVEAESEPKAEAETESEPKVEAKAEAETEAEAITEAKVEAEDEADILWEMSFGAAERTLIRSLSITQRKCHALLLSLCRKHVTCRGGLLAPGHLTHVVFWTCEQSTAGIWREDNMAECLLLLLDRVLHFVCAGSLPDYFLPARNLLTNLRAGDIACLAGQVASVRRAPVAAFRAAYRELEFGDEGATCEELFRPVFSFLERYPGDEHPLECIIQAAFTIGHVCLSRGQNEAALVLFEEGCELMLQICQPDSRSIAVLRLTAWLYRQLGLVNKAIEYYEIVCTLHKLKDVVGSFDFQTCLANLACLYHVKALTCPDDTIALHLIDKARSCFDIAHAESPCRQVALHYAIFLLKMGEVEKAVTMLVDVASREDENDDGDDRKLWSDFASFVEAEADILDDDLANEVHEAGELQIPTAVLIQYLISKGLLQLGLLKQGKESNKALEGVCRSGDGDNMAVSWALLGYCFKAAGDLRLALRSFASALKEDDYYPLAEDNYNECRVRLGGEVSDSNSEGDQP